MSVFLQGDVPPPQVSEDDGNIYLTDERPWEEDNVPLKTVGPVLPREIPEAPVEMIARIDRLKHEAFALGWIKNQGLLHSLCVKLQHARENLEQGQVGTARNQLVSFQNELEAQRGKGVTQEAYDLLHLNVELVLLKLQ